MQGMIRILDNYISSAAEMTQKTTKHWEMTLNLISRKLLLKTDCSKDTYYSIDVMLI